MKQDLAKLREDIVEKYSSASNLDEEATRAALIGVEDTEIFDNTFTELYEKYTPRANVYMNLCKKFTVTQAKAILKTVETSMVNPIDFNRELNFSLHQVDAQVASLRDIIHKIQIGKEGFLDLEPSTLFAELRQWLTFRNNIINNTQGHILTDKKLDIEARKVDKALRPVGRPPVQDAEGKELDLENMSTEELEAMLKGGA